MIKQGSTVVLRTKEAIFSPCKVMAITKENITVTYFAGTKRDRETGEFSEVHPVETISMKNVKYLSERI